jgi:hypothetical protein
LLFVLAADVLHSLINQSLADELLKRPLNLQCSHSFPVLRYADDTLVIMEADVAHLHHLDLIDFWKCHWFKSELCKIHSYSY